MNVQTLNLNPVRSAHQRAFNHEAANALSALANQKLTRQQYVNRIWELRRVYGIWESTSLAV